MISHSQGNTEGLPWIFKSFPQQIIYTEWNSSKRSHCGIMNTIKSTSELGKWLGIEESWDLVRDYGSDTTGTWTWLVKSSDKSFCIQWWVDKLTIITEKWDFWVITDRSMKMWGQCSSSQENKCNSRNYYERNWKQNRKLHYALFVEIHDTCTFEYCAQFLLVKTQQRSGGFPEVKGTPGQWRALPGASSSYGR